MRYFRVRLGSENAQFEDGFKRGYVGVDYDIHEDLTPLLDGTPDEVFPRIKEKFRSFHPDNGVGSVGQCAGNIWYCTSYMSQGDVVFTKDAQGNFYHGVICRDYQWNPGSVLQHQRPVQWSGFHIQKSAMSKGLSDSIDSPKTCIELLDEHMEELTELIQKAKNKHNAWKQNIDGLIHDYAARFDDIAPNERYKWEIAYHFQQHWDLEADDFATMLEKAIETTGNLLKASNYYPHGMITGLAKSRPEVIRTAFRRLLDPNDPVEDRVRDFRQFCAELTEQLREEGDKHFQDDRSCSVYLALHNPDEYALYMQSVFKETCERLKHPFNPKRGGARNLREWNGMLHTIADRLKAPGHQGLINRHEARLGDDTYRGQSHLMLAQDIAYAVRNYLKD